MYQDKMTPEVESSVRQNIDSLTSLVKERRNDTGFRSKMASEPHHTLNENGFDIPETMDINVVANTQNLFHVTFPPDPNAAISDELLSLVSAGGPPQSTSSSLVTSLSTIAVWELDY